MVRDVISPQHGRMRIFESIKQEAFDNGAFLVRTEGDYDYLVEVKINRLSLKLDKMDAYGDPEPHMDLAITVKPVAKPKK